jgi:hypothetical protein
MQTAWAAPCQWQVVPPLGQAEAVLAVLQVEVLVVKE